MAQVTGLGRGLNSLIPNKKTELSSNNFSSGTGGGTVNVGSEVGERIIELPIDKLTPNSQQPRVNFPEEELKELQKSIEEHGLIQPIIVSKDGSQWQIIAGERRWRAMKALGKSAIPAIVRSINEQKKLEVALIENLHRADLNPLEMAMAYHKLTNEFNISLEELADKVGKGQSTVVNTLRLLNIIEPAKEALISGKITEGHARALAGLPANEQLAVLERIINEGMNVREAESATRKIVVQKHIRKLHVDPDVVAKTERLQQFLGTKVEIKKSGEVGQIVIKFFSNDEFNDIFKKIGN